MDENFIDQFAKNHNLPLPENDTLLEFDSFLIGDGSNQLMKKMNRPAQQKFQLTGINNLEDLINPSEVESGNLDIIDDLGEYSVEADEFDESLIDYFYSIKKEIFDRFDYLKKKSESMQGLPFREKDLVLTKDEHFLLDYLVSSGLQDYAIIDSLAQLKAFSELGFVEVKFVQSDCCPLCEAYDGIIYTIDFLISIFGAGKFLIHENCHGTFIPVVRNRKDYYGPLEITIEESFVGEILVKNLPIEYKDELSDISAFLDYEEIHFVNLTDFSDYEDEVIRECGNILYVSDSYCGDTSSFDFIKIWLDTKDTSDRSDEIASKIREDDVYFLNGRKVVELEGLYFDVSTKEQIK